MKRNTLALLVGLVLSGTAHAALQGRDLDGNLSTAEAYYDTGLNITWLADANYANTSGYIVSAYSIYGLDNANFGGQMFRQDAIIWAANLSFTDGVNVYDNWRLPTVAPINGDTFNLNDSYIGNTDWGFNIGAQGTAFAGSTANEMAHLFYSTLGNKSYCDPATAADSSCAGPQAGWGLTNTGPFTNLQAGAYWSATVYHDINGDSGFVFAFSDGSQATGPGLFPNDNVFYSLAVSPGDVGVATVPEADTWAMLLAGLGLVGVATRRRRG